MLYQEISMYEITNNPKEVNIKISDNARHFSNDLYFLTEGSDFLLDNVAKQDLRNLAKRILDAIA